MLKKFFSSRGLRPQLASETGIGERIYAIGDVHGCMALLENLLEQIARDDAMREPALTRIIFLGDLIDRGPDSAEVVEQLRQLAGERANTEFILGNHEEVFLAALEGSERALRGFCRIGGRETIISYGVSADRYDRMDYDELGAVLRELVPAEHVAFLKSFGNMAVSGDYAFVHAGIDPRKPLAEQRETDLRWIREPFLGFRGALEKRIVHGHTIAIDVEWHPHRIGLDTGAYETGRLTALALERGESWLLQT